MRLPELLTKYNYTDAEQIYISKLINNAYKQNPSSTIEDRERIAMNELLAELKAEKADIIKQIKAV